MTDPIRSFCDAARQAAETGKPAAWSPCRTRLEVVDKLRPVYRAWRGSTELGVVGNFGGWWYARPVAGRRRPFRRRADAVRYLEGAQS